MVKKRVIAALALLLSACEGRAYRQAQLLDTPEAYEAFLDAHPRFEQRDFVDERIDELRWVDAKNEGSSEGFRAYQRWMPAGRHIDEARKREEEAAFGEALAAGTTGDLDAYLARYPQGAFRRDAETAIEARAYLGHISLTGVTLDRREAGIQCIGRVKNSGDRVISAVQADIRWLDTMGQVVLSERVFILGSPDRRREQRLVPAAGEAPFRWVPDVPPADPALTAVASVVSVRLAPLDPPAP